VLAPLATQGRWLVEADSGRSMVLRGVNVSGMEYSRERYSGLRQDDLRYIVQDWGARVVRLPFNQDWVLRGRNGDDYARELEDLASWLEVLDAYTILDLQWLDANTIWGPGDNRVPPQPDNESIECWLRLAERFQGHHSIIFDLFNEPHDVPRETWLDWARQLTEAVRSVDSSRVVMVGGMDWAYDLRGIEIPFDNVIYSTHVYRNKGQTWAAAFGDLALRRPVFAGEWGGEVQDLDWGRDLANYFRALDIGWTAWSWCDFPHLRRHGRDTPFGELVRSQLL
jgi:endoglucanase